MYRIFLLQCICIAEFYVKKYILLCFIVSHGDVFKSFPGDINSVLTDLTSVHQVTVADQPSVDTIKWNCTDLGSFSWHQIMVIDTSWKMSGVRREHLSALYYNSAGAPPNLCLQRDSQHIDGRAEIWRASTFKNIMNLTWIDALTIGDTYPSIHANVSL